MAWGEADYNESEETEYTQSAHTLPPVVYLTILDGV